jgi:hypothetical protein
MSKRDVLNSPRLAELKRHRRRAWLGKFFLFLLGLLVIFALLTYISRLPNLNITEIQITGNKVVDTEALRTIVQEQIAGKYLWLFPKTNILFYPQKSIRTALQMKFKSLQDINLSIQENKILIVSLTEREAKYTWCGAVVPEANSNSNQKCYFMDATGYIFDEAPYFSEGVYFKFYGSDGVNVENPSAGYFLKDTFAKLITFKDRIESFGLHPSAFWLDNIGDANFFLVSKSNQKPEIIFKIDADLEKVAENLQAALTTEPLQSKFKNKYGLLQYIDLRYGNKVFYKFNE